MGCGASHLKNADISFEEENPVEAYMYRFNTHFKAEEAAGVFIRHCIEKVTENTQQKPVHECKWVQLPIDNQDIQKQILQNKITQRQEDIDLTQFKPNQEHQKYLQDKYALIKEEEKRKEEGNTMKKTRSELEPDVMLEASYVPKNISHQPLKPEHLYISFQKMYEIFKQDICYIMEYDIFQLMQYLRFDTDQPQPALLIGDFSQFKRSPQYKEDNISLQSYLTLYYMLCPECYTRIKECHLDILFYCADNEMYNTYADSFYLIKLLKQHFPQLDEFITVVFKRLSKETFIQKDNFDKLTPLILKELKQRGIHDLQMNLSTYSLSDFLSRKKSKISQSGRLINNLIQQFQAKLKQREGRFQNVTNNSTSQKGMLDDEGMKEELEIEKAFE